MNDTIINIDNIEVHISPIIRANVGEYTVFKNKLWYITGSFGCGINHRQRLERPKEHVILYTAQNTKLFKVMKPTGYIDI